ncbi:MAG: SPOR domain-containing protein, partial [Rhodobacteraceae bacterium]|nr:SPOR domain-containing protein [Paracoccaceae bacterium]
PAPGPGSALDKPFIQIGIFSVEENARNTAVSLRTQGVEPLIKEHETKGKKFWRVIVGPATSKGERAALLKKAQGLGFADAYFVTN